MGQRNAGLVRAGFRRAGAGAAAATAAAAGWGDSVSRRMIALSGLDPESASVEWERFAALGSTSPGIVTGGDDFGPNWVVTKGSSGYIAHHRSDGGSWPGGVAVIQVSTGVWTDSNFFWKGVGMARGTPATERWGLAFRAWMQQLPSPSGAGYNSFYFAFKGDTGFVALGYEEATSLNQLVLTASGAPATIISSATLAGMHDNGFVEIMLIGKPQGVVDAYLARQKVATITSSVIPATDNTSRPYFGTNQGTLLVDDVLIVFGGQPL